MIPEGVREDPNPGTPPANRAAVTVL